MLQSIIIYITIINLIGFSLMYMDKQRAIRQKYRISEGTLWFIALIGGSVGSTLAMNTFRHKTQHFQFKYGLPTLIIIHLAIAIYFIIKPFNM